MDASFWAPAITFSIITLTIGTVFVLRGPVGKALGQWIAGWSHTEAKWIEGHYGASGAEVAELRVEVEELRHQLTDVQERLDFAERLLARQRDAERLRPGAAS
jgi:hypothetical protein